MEITNWKTIKDFLRVVLPLEKENPAFRILINLRFDRINVEWWVFFVAGAATILIALITISIQAIKAAIANPVKSLRTE